MNRPVLLVLALLAAAAIWVAYHWDEVRVAMGIEEPTALRAVHIAKSDYSLARHIDNHAVIEEEMEQSEGVEVIGWQAEGKTDRLYLVKFLFTLNGEPGGYYFEVDVASTSVRHIEAESELARKYGVAPTPR